jgi:DNA-binding NtrC family response regulator
VPAPPLACLIVEDQAPVAEALEVLFSLHDVPTRRASDADSALAEVRTGGVGVVLQDMNFAPGETSGDEGAALFHAIRAIDPAMPVLLMTAFTSLERAVSLVKAGATDYFGKPWDDARLVASVRGLLDMRTAQGEHVSLGAGQDVHGSRGRSGAARPDLGGLVFQSEAMARLVDLAIHVATADVPVLITGPNGAGKEKIARIIQANSPRAGHAFVTVNVGALPDTLLEAELFGAEAGAFTGAQRRRVGRFEAAHGGTLFLDEIGTLSLAGQAKLLRVLQTGEYERLGSSTPLRSDVRLLCATNVHLPGAIAAGLFREDLYFRLNVIELAVPALRDRPDDVLPIARHLLARHGATPALGPEAERALLAYSWPGNVRELENRLQRARLVARGNEIGPEDLGLATGMSSSEPQRSTSARATEDTSETGSSRSERPRSESGPYQIAGASSERDALEEVLRAHGGSVSRAAEALGLSRQALYRRMERLGVSLERRPRS